MVAGVLGFFEHWRSLCGGALLPMTESYLDTLPPRFAGGLYIVEVKSDSLVLRFQGAELVERWGTDRTGLDIAAHRTPEFRHQVRTLMTTIVTQPCGYHSRSMYSTSRGRMIDAHYIALPLAVREGRSPRVAAYTFEFTALKQGEASWDQFDILEHGWIDIGKNTPAETPVVLG